MKMQARRSLDAHDSTEVKAVNDTAVKAVNHIGEKAVNHMRCHLNTMWGAGRPVSRGLGAVLSGVLLVALCLVLPSAARAGANETPGSGGRPHAFAYFNPNQWEFGARDIDIFQYYVVELQHYSQGAGYVDATFDLSSGGAGIANFFVFCADQKHDVMLVASHGIRTPSTATMVESYPKTAAGKAVRDSTWAFWNSVFAPGSFIKDDWRYNYVICATQVFYSIYFRTPQAYCYWATCWSAFLNMTGPGMARCYLGYDRVVRNGKVWCDEATILRRMNGFEGQSKRPLAPAISDINSVCTYGSAKLRSQGRLNTVLSPSVTDHAPTGIVCESMPGHVQFDTTMDTSVPANSVIIAKGDGHLIDRTWVGDDRIQFTVVPDEPQPNILYDVLERRARSNADRARLDGNTRPAINAYGPNRDDFIWITNCPPDEEPPTPPVEVVDPVGIVVGERSPGSNGSLVVPVTNLTDQVQSISLTPTLFEPMPVAVLSVEPYGWATASWDLDIPLSAVPGEEVAITCVTDAGDEYTGSMVIAEPLVASVLGRPRLSPGEIGQVDVVLENTSGIDMEVTSVVLFGVPLWPITQVDGFSGGSLPPGAIEVLSFEVDVPLDGSGPFAMGLDIASSAGDYGLSLGAFSVTYPVDIDILSSAVYPAAGTGEQGFLAELVNWGALPREVDLVAFDEGGNPVVVEYDPFLPVESASQVLLHVDIPPDPALIGQSGTVFLQVSDADDPTQQIVFDVPYLIEPAISIPDFPGGVPTRALFTGSAIDQEFEVPVMLTNHSDLELVVSLAPEFDPGLQVVPPPPTAVPPHATVEIPLQAVVVPDTPAGLYEGTLVVEADSPIGNMDAPFAIQVHEPVEIDLLYRGVSAAPGETLPIEAAIENIRDDQPMSLLLTWTDEQGWLVAPDSEHLLAPGQRDTVEVELVVPEALAVSPDSNVVHAVASFIYDTGLGATSEGELQVEILGVTSDVPDAPVPVAGGIGQIGPNPFAPQTTVRFRVAAEGPVRLTVHDASGRRVRLLADESLGAGEHARSWDARDEHGTTVPAGVYFFRLQTPQGQWTEKAVRMK